MAWSETALTQAWIFETTCTENFSGAWGNQNDWRCAVFNNTITPRKALDTDVMNDIANFQYGVPAGLFPVASEVRGDPAAAWPFGGRPVPGTGTTAGYDVDGSSVVFDGGPATSDGAVTITNMHGDVLYQTNMGGAYPRVNLVAAYHWFGGAVNVNSGFFAVIWGPAGIMRIDTAGYGPPPAP